MDQNNEAVAEQKFESEQFQNIAKKWKMKMGKKQWRKDLPVKEEKILQDNKMKDPDKNRIGFAKLISNQFIFTKWYFSCLHASNSCNS